MPDTCRIAKIVRGILLLLVYSTRMNSTRPHNRSIQIIFFRDGVLIDSRISIKILFSWSFYFPAACFGGVVPV